MTGIDDLDAYVEGLADLADRGRIDEALTSLVNMTLSFTEREPTHGRVFSSKALDAAALALGRRQIPPPVAEPRKGVVAIVTALYSRGGHTRVLKDLFDAEGGGPTHVLVTNVGHHLTKAGLKDILPADVTIEIAEGAGLASRLRWLQDRLAALGPERTYLFQHPFDAVAVAAAQPSLVGKLYFYHHADHSLTLGLHIPGAVHIDANSKIFHHCREKEGLAENVYWPLTGGVETLPAPEESIENDGLVTCCSGGMEKFEPVCLVERLPYRIAYPAAVVQILRVTGGRHVHIGSLSQSLLEGVATALLSAGLPAKSFDHFPHAADLGEAMRREGVQLYLGSFPRGGGRANIEAMARGLPLLLHDNYRSAFLTSTSEAYEGAPSWRTLAELAAQLRLATPERLAEHGRLAWAHYEREHMPAAFTRAVRDTVAGCNDRLPPAAPPHRADPVQSFMDERSAEVTPLAPLPDLLARLSERNRPRKPSGFRLDDSLVDSRFHQRVLPDGKGLYLHARAAQGATALALMSSATFGTVLGLEVTAKVADPLGEAVEAAVLIPRPGTTLQEVAHAIPGDGEPSAEAPYEVALAWSPVRAATKLSALWRGAPTESVIIALRMAASAGSNRHAQVTFTDVSWKDA